MGKCRTLIVTRSAPTADTVPQAGSRRRRCRSDCAGGSARTRQRGARCLHSLEPIDHREEAPEAIVLVGTGAGQQLEAAAIAGNLDPLGLRSAPGLAQCGRGVVAVGRQPEIRPAHPTQALPSCWKTASSSIDGGSSSATASMPTSRNGAPAARSTSRSAGRSSRRASRITTTTTAETGVSQAVITACVPGATYCVVGCTQTAIMAWLSLQVEVPIPTR